MHEKQGKYKKHWRTPIASSEQSLSKTNGKETVIQIVLTKQNSDHLRKQITLI